MIDLQTLAANVATWKDLADLITEMERVLVAGSPSFWQNVDLRSFLDGLAGRQPRSAHMTAASSSIRIGVLGRITAGEEFGRFVKVVDDAEYSGGLLILTAANAELTDEPADGWVEDEENLAAYFEGGAWTVEWLDADDQPTALP